VVDGEAGRLVAWRKLLEGHHEGADVVHGAIDLPDVVELPVPEGVGRDVGALERILQQIENLLQAQFGEGLGPDAERSGQALFGSGGTIVGSSLENSNTDIADEFTKLIVTQQAYSANTKVITTSNSMVQDLLNVLR